MADPGHYGVREAGKSRQGIYVFTAQGKFLASVNSLSADVVLETIHDGLAKWHRLPESERAATKVVAPKHKHRWEDYCPRDEGLVLNGYSRDLSSLDDPDSDRLPFWNRDSAWFSKEESSEFIPADVQAGQTFALPEVFVTRICSIHLVDAVKGQSDNFAASEIADTRLNATVTERTDKFVRLSLSGSTKANCTTRPVRGVETTLQGSATFDLTNRRFTQFEFIAIGHRWGRTQFNDRRKQLEKTPIGFTFELAKANDPIIVPGIFWAYDVPWMPQP